MTSARRARGFTLLEVMVALLIFALLAASVQRTSSQYFSQFARIEGKTLGTWIAENQLAQLRLQDALPGIAENSDELDYADRHWRVTTKVSATQEPKIRRVDITVSLFEDQGQEPAQQIIYSGFVGKR